MQIANQYSKILTTQEYEKKIPIKGVKFHQIKYHRDEGGDFVELGRLSQGKLEGFDSFVVRQVSSSQLLPGTVKAFHIHLKQADIWYVSPLERMLVGLLDTRKDAETVDQTMRFVMGAGQAKFLYIPPGVAHGAANLWDKPVTMTYFTDRWFNSTDEHRLPFNLFGEDFWKIKKG